MRHILPFFALSSRGVFAAPWQLPSRTATPAALRIDHLQASATLTSAPALLHRTASPVSIPALTTTFAPLAACLQDIYVYVYTSEQTFTFASLGTSNITACYPPGWRSDSTMHFSPGICPSGYMIACSSTGQVSDLHETTATCCPR
jgi:hypothetical protein